MRKAESGNCGVYGPALNGARPDWMAVVPPSLNAVFEKFARAVPAVPTPVNSRTVVPSGAIRSAIRSGTLAWDTSMRTPMNDWRVSWMLNRSFTTSGRATVWPAPMFTDPVELYVPNSVAPVVGSPPRRTAKPALRLLSRASPRVSRMSGPNSTL